MCNVLASLVRQAELTQFAGFAIFPVFAGVSFPSRRPAETMSPMTGHTMLMETEANEGEDLPPKTVDTAG
ncbi:MAG: hypothetical protein IPM59_05280 [Chloracidobacterium sp.]|nr:hypothetical protein [Chloracidobacterium sp.]